MTKARDLATAASAFDVVTVAELEYVDGVTSAIQTQMDAKLATATASSTYQPLVSGVSNTEIGYLDGVTSAIQTQLNQKPEVAAGKNAIINGGMDIWQRGTSITTSAGYTADRWYLLSGASGTVTRSTAKTTPNSTYMMLMTASTTQQLFALQSIESINAIYYAGKTVTLSGYAAGLTTTTNLNMALQYSTTTDEGVLGAGWTATTFVSGSPDLTLSSTVTRFSATFSVPSTAKSLRVQFVNNAANITVGQGIYLGDVQLEVGSVATPFSRAGGTIAGELAACQRYFTRLATDSGTFIGQGMARSGSVYGLFGSVPLPVAMRTAPSLAYSGIIMEPNAGGGNAITSLVSRTTLNNAGFFATQSGNFSANDGLLLRGSTSGNYIDASSEL